MKNVKNRFFYLIISICFVLFVAVLASCKSASTRDKELPPSVVTNDSTETTITYRDTLLLIESDSSWYKAYIDCKAGNPVLRNAESQAGKRVNKPKVNLQNNLLTVDCESEQKQLKARIKELESVTSKSTTVKIPVLTERSKSNWEKFIQTSGYAFWALVLLLVIAFFLKK